MPSVTIMLDAMNFRIDSSDRDLIAKWMMETLERVQNWNNATFVRFQIHPLGEYDKYGTFHPDWPVNDSRWLGRHYEVSPEGIDQFAEDMREALHATVGGN